MSLERPVDADEPSYGELLGEYFAVVAEIGDVLDEFGMPPRDEDGRYHRLRERKAAIRERLAEMERDQDREAIQAILDEALQSD